jgi:hypothetical protein
MYTLEKKKKIRVTKYIEINRVVVRIQIKISKK